MTDGTQWLKEEEALKDRKLRGASLSLTEMEGQKQIGFLEEREPMFDFEG